MTDVSTDVSTQYNAHNHTNVQETETFHTTNCVKFLFLITTFSALRVGLHLTKNPKLHICFILNIFQEQMWPEWLYNCLKL